MIAVGLTGNAASGKTVVADRWRDAGVHVVDADRLGHAVLESDDEAKRALVAAFGDAIVRADGTIDRGRLGDAAFASREALDRLNAIVHPPLIERLRVAIESARHESEPLVVIDAALVFEFGLDCELDLIVLVTAPRELRERRLRERVGLADERIRQLLAAQMPDVEKVDRCDYVIVNDGSIELLHRKADFVLADLRRAGSPAEDGGLCAGSD